MELGRERGDQPGRGPHFSSVMGGHPCMLRRVDTVGLNPGGVQVGQVVPSSWVQPSAERGGVGRVVAWTGGGTVARDWSPGGSQRMEGRRRWGRGKI